jgi:putative aldouronate transport system permease protein
LAKQLFAPNMPAGLVNIVINRLGGQSVPFLDNSSYWVGTYIMLGVWQSVGWNTIIYLAALTTINQELYEAASVDGASRLRKMWHITLPGLRPTIVTLLIMSLGKILGSEFDRPYAMSNKLVTGVSNVISIFVYNNGIKSSQFALTSAVGLFQSVICVIFLVGANSMAKKIGERGIW